MSNTKSFAVILLTLAAAVVTAVAFSRLPPHSADPRLLGTWQSDADETIAELREQHPLTDLQVTRLQEIYGKLRVTYRFDRTATSDFNGFVETDRYAILSRDSDSLELRVISTRPSEMETLGIPFDPFYRAFSTLVCSVSAVSEIVAAFLGPKIADELADAVPE